MKFWFRHAKLITCIWIAILDQQYYFENIFFHCKKLAIVWLRKLLSVKNDFFNVCIQLLAESYSNFTHVFAIFGGFVYKHLQWYLLYLISVHNTYYYVTAFWHVLPFYLPIFHLMLSNSLPNYQPIIYTLLIKSWVGYTPTVGT